MTAKQFLSFSLAILPCLQCFATENSNEIRYFRSTDIFELEYAKDPRISPGGDRIVYERHSNDIMSDETRSNLWVVNSNGSGHRPIVSGAIQASSPRWSKDGERIAYVRSEQNLSTIQVRWMDTGQTAQAAVLQKKPSSLTWSPDGQWLAFVMPVVVESEPLAEPPDMPEGAEWSEPVKVIDSVIYRRDGEGFLEPAYSHIFIVPADGGTPRR